MSETKAEKAATKDAVRRAEIVLPTPGQMADILGKDAPETAPAAPGVDELLARCRAIAEDVALGEFRAEHGIYVQATATRHGRTVRATRSAVGFDEDAVRLELVRAIHDALRAIP